MLYFVRILFIYYILIYVNFLDTHVICLKKAEENFSYFEAVLFFIKIFTRVFNFKFMLIIWLTIVIHMQ